LPLHIAYRTTQPMFSKHRFNSGYKRRHVRHSQTHTNRNRRTKSQTLRNRLIFKVAFRWSQFQQVALSKQSDQKSLNLRLNPRTFVSVVLGMRLPGGNRRWYRPFWYLWMGKRGCRV
jgi:hypothetical protein